MKTEIEDYGKDLAYFKRGNVTMTVVDKPSKSSRAGTRYHIYITEWREHPQRSKEIAEKLPPVKGFRRYNDRHFYSITTSDRNKAVEELLDALDGTDLYIKEKAHTKEMEG